MRFLPLTRQVELSQSSPEGLVFALPGTFFYRRGNDHFFLVDRNYLFSRVDVSKRAFALKYQNQVWYSTAKDEDIIFTNPYEIWQKSGDYSNYGWKFISYSKLETDFS